MTAPDSTPTVREAGDEGIAAVLAAEVCPRGSGPCSACSDAARAILTSNWLAEREAKAWDEGYGCGRDDECADQRGYEPTGYPNPYRAALAPETPEGDA